MYYCTGGKKRLLQDKKRRFLPYCRALPQVSAVFLEQLVLLKFALTRRSTCAGGKRWKAVEWEGKAPALKYPAGIWIIGKNVYICSVESFLSAALRWRN